MNYWWWNTTPVKARRSLQLPRQCLTLLAWLLDPSVREPFFVANTESAPIKDYEKMVIEALQKPAFSITILPSIYFFVHLNKRDQVRCSNSQIT
jgi:hypothetical protein